MQELTTKLRFSNVVTDNKELTDKNFFAFFAAYNEIEVKAVPYQFFNGKYYGTNGTYTKLDGNFSIKWTLSEGLILVSFTWKIKRKLYCTDQIKSIGAIKVTTT